MEVTDKVAAIQPDTTGGNNFDRVLDWMGQHASNTENYLRQDFGKFYGPNASMPTVPKSVTDYFNEVENRTTDPKELERLAKVRELTEANYGNQREYLNKYIDSQAKKISIQYSVQMLKKTTNGITQIISSS